MRVCCIRFNHFTRKTKYFSLTYSLNFIHTSEAFGEEMTRCCSSGSGSGLCGVSGSGGSVLEELSSLCLLSSNSNRC